MRHPKLKRIRKFAALLTGLAVGLAACASDSAAARAERIEHLFAGHDGNLDRRLSGTEFRDCGCGEYDTDGDGEVTRAEFFVGYAARQSTHSRPGK